MSSSPTSLTNGCQLIQLRSGILLECNISLAPASLNSPPDDAITNVSRARLAICLHPWSWLGGRMDDPVLQTLMEPLHQRGYHVLRYNSRGVGKSTGWSSLTGSREARDLQELVQWAVDHLSPIQSLVVIGYSYGSLIASLQPLLPEPKVSHVLISYPLGARHWLTAFHGRSYAHTLDGLIRDPQSNVLIVHGDRDEFTSAEMYDEWTNGFNARAGSEGGKLQVVKIEHATHFWLERGAVARLLEVLAEWLPA